MGIDVDTGISANEERAIELLEKTLEALNSIRNTKIYKSKYKNKDTYELANSISKFLKIV